MDTGGYENPNNPDDVPSDPEHGNDISSQSEQLCNTKALNALQSHNKPGLKEYTEHYQMRGTMH